MIVMRQNDGIITQDMSDPKTAYITLAADAGSALKQALIGAAPVTGIAIAESVDLDWHKAFDSNYTLSVFGQSLTNITIHGFDVYAALGEDCTSMDNDIQSWWNTYNPQVDPSKRITVSIYSRNNSAIYECVAVSLARLIGATTQITNATIGQYNLTIVGVKKD